jgi:PDZ domain-containing secreted protein
VHVFDHGNAVRGFDLCGVDEGDPDMRRSFLNVVSFLEENKRRLEKWLGRSLRWPRHGQEAKVTFDSSTFSSYPSGPSSGAAIFLSFIRLLAGVPYRRFVAITGTVSISGHFGSVGSVPAKLDAAMDAAVMSTIVPTANYRALERHNLLGKYDKVVAAKDIVDILHYCLDARGTWFLGGFGASVH